VAPPAPQVFTPWATVLEQHAASDRYEWVLGDDGVLVPVPTSDDGPASPSKIKAMTARVAALLGR
jgi:hypothetical protein